MCCLFLEKTHIIMIMNSLLWSGILAIYKFPMSIYFCLVYSACL